MDTRKAKAAKLRAYPFYADRALTPAQFNKLVAGLTLAQIAMLHDVLVQSFRETRRIMMDVMHRMPAKARQTYIDEYRTRAR